jgi:hypothetical protein
MWNKKKSTHQVCEVNKKEGEICKKVVSSKSQNTSNKKKGENLNFVKIPFGCEKNSNSQAKNNLDLFDICI